MKYDVVVIGSGPGGYVAAIRSAQLGLKTACIEKASTLGGTCLNVGCIPSKALLQSSEHFAWMQQDSKEHGISCQNLAFDLSQMMSRKTKVVEGLVQGVAWLFKKHNIDSIRGTATLLPDHQISIEGKTVEFKNCILATGSEPIALPFLPFDEKVIVSSTGVLSLSKVPKRMLVIGAGVIGVELASVYRRLGSEVTIVEMLERICPTMDEGLSKALWQSLKKQGMTFHLGSKVVGAERTKTGISVQVDQNRIEVDVVLVAIGRKPYTKSLGLENCKIDLQRGFVTVDANFQTSMPGVYAIGDLIEGPMLAHKASEEGFAVAEILAGNRPHVNYMAIPNVIYTHPEVASVGYTVEEAKQSGLEIVVGESSFKGNPRARCGGFTEGFVKVIGFGPNKHLIGMHIIGPQASELIDVGVMAIENRTTLKVLAQAPHAHPTLAECIKEACGQALNCAIHSQ